MTNKEVMRQARNAFVWNLNTDLDNIPACDQWAKMLRKNIDALDKAIADAELKWVGLTDEEIKAFDTWHDNREEEVGWVNPSEIVAYIDAKLKHKNGYAEEKNT
jgi:hypothetical protein